MFALKVAKGIDPGKARVFAARLMGRPHSLSCLTLIINDNNTSLVSARPEIVGKRGCSLSVHWSFFNCDDDVLDALLGIVTPNPLPEHSRVLRFFIDRCHANPAAALLSSQDAEHADTLSHEEIVNRALRRITLCSRGVVYDLHRLLHELNDEFFGGKLAHLRVTWMTGVRAVDRKRRGLTFGSYDSRLDLVRIHPCLDGKNVPEFFVRFVLYHEMLHALMDQPRRPGKRHVVHTEKFRRMEKRFPQYADAKMWEEQFVRNL